MRETVWELRFNALATYNAEVARGIIHTCSYEGQMHKLQVAYDDKLLEISRKEGDYAKKNS